MAKGVVAIPCIPNGSISINTVNRYGIASKSGQNMVAVAPGADIYRVFTGKVGSAYVTAYSNKPYNSTPAKIYYVYSGSTISVYNAGISNSYSYIGEQYNYYNFYSSETGQIPASIDDYDAFNNLAEMIQYIAEMENLTVQYISGSITVAGPRLVSEGSTVTAYLGIPNGVTVTVSDISVTKSGVSIPFTYSNGVLTFTA